MTYQNVIHELEQLSIMPKTMPGLVKLQSALAEVSWFREIDQRKIITVAGTNGKGTTCAALETLLMSANQKVGLFTSPHLITTTERIRINAQDISENDFVRIYLKHKNLIQKHQLTHFESLTLLAAVYFFEENTLDYIIFEVGLGGLHDATNVFPNQYSIITKLGLDHQNILGKNLFEIAQNKFGIIKNNSVVVHHSIEDKTVYESLQKTVADKKCECFEATSYGQFKTNLIGQRAFENINTAITVFEKLGFNFLQHVKSLESIRWSGRMQKVDLSVLNNTIQCDAYLSGDHNQQGMQSLVDILNDYQWNKLHLIVGIGQDKCCEPMLDILRQLKDIQFYLTQTPFKGLDISDYPEKYKKIAVFSDNVVFNIIKNITTEKNDLIVVTGSLYLVGEVLSQLSGEIRSNK